MHEVNESDLDTVHATGENDLFIDSIDFDKHKSQAFAKVALGPNRQPSIHTFEAYFHFKWQK